MSDKLTTDELIAFSLKLDAQLIDLYAQAVRVGLTPELKKLIDDVRAYDEIIRGAASAIWRTETAANRDSAASQAVATKGFDA